MSVRLIRDDQPEGRRGNELCLHHANLLRIDPTRLRTLQLNHLDAILNFENFNLPSLVCLSVTNCMFIVLASEVTLAPSIRVADFTGSTAVTLGAETDQPGRIARGVNVTMQLTEGFQSFFGARGIHAANLPSSMIHYGGWCLPPGNPALVKLHLTLVDAEFGIRGMRETVQDLTLVACSGEINHTWPVLRTLVIKDSEVSIEPEFAAPNLGLLICPDVTFPPDVLARLKLEKVHVAGDTEVAAVASSLSVAIGKGSASVFPADLAGAVGCDTFGYAMNQEHNWCISTHFAGEGVFPDPDEPEDEDEDDIVNEDDETAAAVSAASVTSAPAECPICYGTLSDGRHFECSHSICKTCDAKMALRAQTRDDLWLVLCPLCRTEPDALEKDPKRARS